MPNHDRHIANLLTSHITIHGQPEAIWSNITNVDIEQFNHPFVFRLLDVPKPLHAQTISEGEGGSRIAYFNTGKRFIQIITIWEPVHRYAFSFNPEKGFTVGYFFDLSEGVFRILEGAYLLTPQSNGIRLALQTRFSIDKRLRLLLYFPVWLVLKLFQRYLLVSIKKNVERCAR